MKTFAKYITEEVADPTDQAENNDTTKKKLVAQESMLTIQIQMIQQKLNKINMAEKGQDTKNVDNTLAQLQNKYDQASKVYQGIK